MYFQKNGNSEGEGGVHDYGILRAWGGNTFWNFRRQRGVETWKPSVVGYGYFLELPIGLWFIIYTTVAIICYVPCIELVLTFVSYY